MHGEVLKLTLNKQHLADCTIMRKLAHCNASEVVGEIRITCVQIKYLILIFYYRLLPTSFTKIIPKCSHMDPTIIDLQLCLMDTV